MPIKIKTDVDFFSVWYIKSDPNQFEHRLTGLLVEPTDKPNETRIKFVLSYMGDETFLYPSECSQEKDETKQVIDED